MKHLLILAVLTIFSGCGNISLEETILIDGSSTVYPITNRILSDYGIDNDINNYSLKVSGSSSGIQRLCSGEIQIANSSRAIKEEEINLCRANGLNIIELQIAKDGIALVVNASNSWIDYLTISELQNIWKLSSEDKITKWSDIRSDWPESNISFYGPTSTSGTYDFFFETLFGDDTPPRGDFVSSENDGFLGRSIAEDLNGMGFFGLAYYKEELFSLKLIPVDDEIAENGDGPVTPSERSVLNNSYSPFSRGLYLYVDENSMTIPEVLDFIEYYLLHVSEIASEVGYIPESSTRYIEYLNQIQQFRLR